MPSECPKCRRVLEEDEICCAQVRYTWRCKNCHKVASGFALPYGQCFMCGGELETISGRELGDSMRFRAIRDAVQFELDSYHFYKLARARAATPEQRLVLERLYEAEVEHLHELEERYHAHLDPDVIDLSPESQRVLDKYLFQDLPLGAEASMADLYGAALEMEKRTRDHFRHLAAELPDGLEKDLCLELAAEEEEHVAMLEGEIEQL